MIGSERLLNRLGAHRVPELVDDDRRLGFASPCGAKRFGGAVPLVLIDVDEAHFCTGKANRMCRARPAQRWADHLVTATHLQRLEREL